jgi:DNA-binding NarL/FixJ family response regulator
VTTILIADDQSLIRSAVRGLLDKESDLEIIGEAPDGRRAVELAVSLRPDVVVMDIRMPVMDGIEATAQICTHPDLVHTRVLILTTFEEDEYLVPALRAGASGFIGKGSEPEEIRHAVRAVVAGDTLLSPRATRALISRYVLPLRLDVALDEERLRRVAHLTEREREVLVLVARGLSNQQIAEEFIISPHTVKTHVNRVMSKTYSHDRAQLVILAYETGLLRPGEA